MVEEMEDNRETLSNNSTGNSPALQQAVLPESAHPSADHVYHSCDNRWVWKINKLAEKDEKLPSCNHVKWKTEGVGFNVYSLHHNNEHQWHCRDICAKEQQADAHE